MPRYPWLLAGSWVMLVGGVLFYVLSVLGQFWPKATPPDDLGLYSVTVILVGFGLAGLFLRWAKIHPSPDA